MRAQWLWQELKFRELFEDMFYLAGIGHIKPSKPYFDRIDQQLGRQEERPLFFDDRDEVVVGARLLGWEAILYNELDDVTAHPWIAGQLDAT